MQEVVNVEVVIEGNASLARHKFNEMQGMREGKPKEGLVWWMLRGKVLDFAGVLGYFGASEGGLSSLVKIEIGPWNSVVPTWKDLELKLLVQAKKEHKLRT